MKVVIIPGARNEELIAEIVEIRAESTEEEWKEYVAKKAHMRDANWFDALYYSDELNNEKELQGYATCFEEILILDQYMDLAESLAKVKLL